MNREDFIDICLCGETSKVQFKREFTSQKEIAKEMVAFSNAKGGTIIFGVEDKTGKMLGLTYEQIQKTNIELGNTANEQVRPTIYVETEVVKVRGKHFLLCHVAEGKNKPYKNLSGEIWMKQGADKRRIIENIEILSLFQDSGFFKADLSGVENSTLQDIDRYALDIYLKKVYGRSLEDFGDNTMQFLENINILNPDGCLTLAAYLFFGKNPQYKYPTCMVKAVSFFGNSIGGMNYRNSKEIEGNMSQVYEQSMAFLLSNLRSVQEEGASFNSLGKLEISESILEEIVQNSLVHRDLLRPAPIRILIFDNRVEIISPGALAGGLTMEDIRRGKTYQRNPHMATFAKNALKYHGIGSGIVRIISENENIVFENDESGNEFITIIPRQTTKGAVIYEESTQSGTQTCAESTQTDDKSTQRGTQTSRKNTQMGTQTDDKSTQRGTQTSRKNTQMGTQTDVESTQRGTQTSRKSTRRGTQSQTRMMVVELIRDNSKISRQEIAAKIGISEDAVKKHLNKLKRDGVIRREGPDFGGKWIIITDTNKEI